MSAPAAPGRTIYMIKELFYTLQGEGLRAGRPAVFCRFSGCNLWNGREQDRHKGGCPFCDTDFIGTDGERGGKYSAASLIEAITGLWPHPIGDAARGIPYVVFTGGEPMLQLDTALCEALHEHGFEIAIETNGTLEVCPGVDWICVSPKAGNDLVQRRGDELKVVYPQDDQDLDALAALPFTHHLLQPLDDSDGINHTGDVVQYCQSHPRWRLSLQTHKLLGIP